MEGWRDASDCEGGTAVGGVKAVGIADEGMVVVAVVVMSLAEYCVGVNGRSAMLRKQDRVEGSGI